MAGSRYPYTLQEDKQILRYIIDGNYVPVIKGNAIWQQMDELGVCQGRSWQSLRNRFLKTIMTDCSRPEYGLTMDEKLLLKIHLSKPILDVVPSTEPKRKIDPRLITRKLQKQANLEDGKKEQKHTPIDEPDRLSQGEKIDFIKGQSENQEMEEMPKSEPEPIPIQPKKKELALSPKKKEFYSLDMEWSDTDSD